MDVTHALDEIAVRKVFGPRNVPEAQGQRGLAQREHGAFRRVCACGLVYPCTQRKHAVTQSLLWVRILTQILPILIIWFG